MHTYTTVSVHRHIYIGGRGQHAAGHRHLPASPRQIRPRVAACQGRHAHLPGHRWTCINTYIWSYMYLYIYICVYIYIYIYMYLYIYLCICVYIYTYIHTHAHTHTHQMCVCVCACVCTCRRTCACACRRCQNQRRTCSAEQPKPRANQTHKQVTPDSATRKKRRLDRASIGSTFAVSPRGSARKGGGGGAGERGRGAGRGKKSKNKYR